MKTFSTKNLIICGVFTALILACQTALSALAGVEVVSILLLTFCYTQGAKSGVMVATAFSLIRCFVFGFVPNAIVLYLVYYNCFALIFGFIGSRFLRKYSIKSHIVACIVAGVSTAFFTLLDCIITPLMYAFSYDAANAYFIASLPVIIPHIICVVATTIFLFFPLVKVFSITINKKNKPMQN